MAIYQGIEFEEKDPRADTYIGFDFGESADPFTFASFEIKRISGAADSDPSAMKLGGPVVRGNSQVVHLLTAGVDFADYEVTCIAYRGGEKLVGVGLLRVRTKKTRF